MARGGYIRPEIAIKKLFKVTGSREKSKQILVDALISKALEAKGRHAVGYTSDTELGVTLRDLTLGDPSFKWKLADFSEIDPDYWSGLNAVHIDEFGWEQGNIRCRTWSNHYGYQEVSFKERDVNALLALHKLQPDRGGKRKEYLPDSTWEDWVAAVAVLAAEQRISGTMNRAVLLEQINTKLEAWSPSPKETSTVGPTARAIITRFRENPPVKPINVA